MKPLNKLVGSQTIITATLPLMAFMLGMCMACAPAQGTTVASSGRSASPSAGGATSDTAASIAVAGAADAADPLDGAELIGTFDLNEAAGYECVVEAYTRDDAVLFDVSVAEGETIGPLHMSGMVELRVTRAAYYPTLAEARQAEDLGSVGADAGPEDGPYLVCDVEFHNVDATPTYELHYLPGKYAFNLSFITLEQGQTETDASGDEVYVPISGALLGSLNDGAEDWLDGVEGSGNLVSVEPGETRTLTLGFRAPENPEGLCLQMMWAGSNDCIYRYPLDALLAKATDDIEGVS